MCTEPQAKKIIQNWSGKSHPKYSQEFFTDWSLLNLYYHSLDSNLKDKASVLKFGRDKNTLMWESVREYANKLVLLECIGNGEGASKPQNEVINATLCLRNFFGITPTSVCPTCRKRLTCSKTIVSSGNAKRFDIEFEALMRIVYQIRNNLFHGNKFALKSDEGILIAGDDPEQAERNKKLICISNDILKQILVNLSQ